MAANGYELLGHVLSLLRDWHEDVEAAKLMSAVGRTAEALAIADGTFPLSAFEHWPGAAIYAEAAAYKLRAGDAVEALAVLKRAFAHIESADVESNGKATARYDVLWTLGHCDDAAHLDLESLSQPDRDILLSAMIDHRQHGGDGHNASIGPAEPRIAHASGAHGDDTPSRADEAFAHSRALARRGRWEDALSALATIDDLERFVAECARIAIGAAAAGAGDVAALALKSAFLMFIPGMGGMGVARWERFQRVASSRLLGRVAGEVLPPQSRAAFIQAALIEADARSLQDDALPFVLSAGYAIVSQISTGQSQ